MHPERADFENYKAIAQANADCLENKITEEERLKRVTEIHQIMDERKERELGRHTADSIKWEALASEQSSEQLQLILDKKHGEYEASFIIAAQKELNKRRGRH